MTATLIVPLGNGTKIAATLKLRPPVNYFMAKLGRDRLIFALAEQLGSEPDVIERGTWEFDEAWSAEDEARWAPNDEVSQ